MKVSVPKEEECLEPGWNEIYWAWSYWLAFFLQIQSVHAPPSHLPLLVGGEAERGTKFSQVVLPAAREEVGCPSVFISVSPSLALFHSFPLPLSLFCVSRRVVGAREAPATFLRRPEDKHSFVGAFVGVLLLPCEYVTYTGGGRRH